MRLDIRECDYGPCPYLGGRRWRVQEFAARSFDASLYESLLAEGWRRSGGTFYRDICPGCELCVPIRLDSRAFAPSRSQRRVARRNADVGVELVDADFSEERYTLYRRYIRARHGADPEEDPSGSERDAMCDFERASYAAFLLRGPLESTRISEYRDGSGRLLATGYIDILPDGLSSVYFAFDPEHGSRSLGTWSVLRELDMARELGGRYYYLGFWVPFSPKMDYKASFRPFEYAREGSWKPAADRQEALAALAAR